MKKLHILLAAVMLSGCMVESAELCDITNDSISDFDLAEQYLCRTYVIGMPPARYVGHLELILAWETTCKARFLRIQELTSKEPRP